MIQDRGEDFSRPKFISSLIELSIKTLSAMFDQQSHLFCFKAIKKGETLVMEGTFLRYTLISLLGLYHYEKHYGKNILNLRKEVEFHRQ